MDVSHGEHNTFQISVRTLREHTGWPRTPFCETWHIATVEVDGGRVTWVDSAGDLRELGTLTPEQLYTLVRYNYGAAL